jgi:NodT family efflux transporter outer membrane factor (OMF) lipoprotein
MPKSLALLAVLSSLLSGCAVGPQFSLPNLPLPAAWQSPPPVTAKPSADWWQQFNDPVLTQLLTLALQNNADLKIARARVEEARGQRLTAQAQLLPEVAATASLSRGRGTEAGAVTNQRQTVADAAWELDLFGGNRRAAESARATLSATRNQQQFVQVSLLAEVARSYLTVRRLQQQLAVAQSRRAAQQGILRIVEAQAREGVVNALDLNRAVSEQASIAADAPLVQASLSQAQNNLAVLAGLQPAQMANLVSNTAPIPLPQLQVALATPANVLANRPDVQRDAATLRAAVAQVGVAESAWWPSLSVGSLFGLTNVASAGVSSLWSASAQAAFSLIDFGRIRGQVRAADARAQAALAAYEQTVLVALADVETALVGLASAQQQLNETQRDAAAAQQLLTLTQQRYDAGLVGKIQVLLAQQSSLLGQNRLAAAQAGLGIALANLFTALGGPASSTL